MSVEAMTVGSGEWGEWLSPSPQGVGASEIMRPAAARASRGSCVYIHTLNYIDQLYMTTRFRNMLYRGAGGHPPDGPTRRDVRRDAKALMTALVLVRLIARRLTVQKWGVGVGEGVGGG